MPTLGKSLLSKGIEKPFQKECDTLNVQEMCQDLSAIELPPIGVDELCSKVDDLSQKHKLVDIPTLNMMKV